MRLHISTDDARTFYVATDLTRALTNGLIGNTYLVRFHERPMYTFYVEAETVDEAHARAVAVIRDGKPSRLRQTGATIIPQ
jgi:hypothetical protein